MTSDVLRILELALVALIYLFFVRVVRAIWAELKGPRAAMAVAAPAPVAATPAPAPAARPVPVPAPPKVPAALRLTAPADVAGRRIALQGTLEVGRAPTNQVVLADPTVSAKHARLVHTGQELLLEDLGSRNGTTLGGRRITGPLPVAVGTVIGFGAVAGVVE